jgi:hypothetical protein
MLRGAGFQPAGLWQVGNLPHEQIGKLSLTNS